MIRRILASIRTHVTYWLELYWFVPLIIIGLTVSIRYVGWITGRDVTEDVGAIPAALVNLVILMVSASVCGLVQKHMIGYRNEQGASGDFLDDCYDTVVFFLMNAGVAYIVFFR